MAVIRDVVASVIGNFLSHSTSAIRDGRAMLDKFAREFCRNPRSIVVVAAPVAAEPDVIKQYEDAGADGIVVFVTPAADVAWAFYERANARHKVQHTCALWGTEGSNPVPSSGESVANLTKSRRRRKRK
jgi:hypothetical protein